MCLSPTSLPNPYSFELEDRLAQYVVEMADMGFGLSPEDVRYTAFRIADASGRPHLFQNGMAGYAHYCVSLGSYLWMQGLPNCEDYAFFLFVGIVEGGGEVMATCFDLWGWS